jgi:hypothetical protein
VTVDPGADSAGLHGWLDGLGAVHALAAAFDTRRRQAPGGRASRAAAQPEPGGGLGRIPFSTASGLIVLAVNYVLGAGTIVLRTGAG